MSRLPWSFWLGSSTSPLAMTMSNLSAGSAGLKPRGAGWAAAWATSVGAWAPAPGVCPASVTPAAAAVVERRKFRRVTSMPDLLARGAAHGRRLAREPEALPRVRDRSALHLEDGHVAVGVVADVEVLAVRAEDDPLGQAAHLDLADLRHLLAVDPQYDDLARAVREPGVLRHAGAAVEQDGDGDLAGRADREALGRVTDDHPIDDARWIRLKVDDTHRVHVTVGGPAVSVVRAVRYQRQIARAVDGEAGGLFADLHRRDVRGRARGQVDDVELGVGRGLPGAAVLRPRHRVGDERQLAVGGDLEVRRRPEDRVHQREAHEDPRRLTVRDVHDGHGVLSGREEDRLSRVVPGHLLVVADEHELRGRLGGRRWRGR